MSKDNIILIGMPGSGKSTIGVVLAKVLGYNFIDSDLLIQESEGRLLKDIIAEDGTEVFIETENRINSHIEAHRTVIATGGSAIYGKEAMEHFNNIGIIVYIKLSCKTISSRISDLHQRGVLFGNAKDLSELYNERTPIYEKYAYLTVDGEKKEIRDMVSIIVEQLRQM